MKVKILLAVGVVVMLVMISLAGCSAAGVDAATTQPISVDVSNQQTGIWVNGQGKITVTPILPPLTWVFPLNQGQWLKPSPMPQRQWIIL